MMESTGKRSLSESRCLDQTREVAIVVADLLPFKNAIDHAGKPETGDKRNGTSSRLNGSVEFGHAQSVSHLNDSDDQSHLAPKLNHFNNPGKPSSQLNDSDNLLQPRSSESDNLLQPASRSSESDEGCEEPIAQKETLGDVFVVVCVFLTNVMNALDITGFGVFYPFLIEHFEASTAAVATSSSINGFAQAICCLLASYPVSAYGCRLPGVIGAILIAVGTSLCFLAPNLTFIYACYGVVSGCGTGFYLISANVILQQRFSRNRGLATGVGWLGGSVGLLIGSIIANYLIQAYGWRGAFLFLGAIQAHRVPLCLFFRTPDRFIVKFKRSPTTNKSDRHIIVRFLKDTFDFRLLRQAKLSLFAVVYTLQLFDLYSYVPHTVNRALRVGLTQDQAVTATVVNSAVAMAARLATAFIVNIPSVNSSLVFGIGMFMAFLSILVIFFLPEIAATMTSAALFGLHQGCTSTILSVVVVDIMGIKALPRSLAILMFIGGFSKFGAPFCIGWIYDVTKDYNAAFSVIGCCGFAGGCLMLVLVFITKRNRKTKSPTNGVLISKSS